MKLFVDTHIFVDFYLDRGNGLKPLGEFAFQLFRRAVECEFFIIVSQEVIGELEKILNKKKEELEKEIFKEIRASNKIEFVNASETQLTEARKIARNKEVPKTDALFALLARDNNAVLVSRDKHHLKLSYLVEVLAPEEL